MQTQAKVLGRRDMTLFTVSAIVLLDTIASSAAIGVSSLTWWAILGVIFLLPMGLITAELGAAYPAEGGIYVWISKAFGRHWGARAVWAYWVNTAIWLPAIYILFAGVFAQLTGLELSIGDQVAMGIVLAWSAMSLELFGLRIGKWIPNLGAAFKILIFLILIIAGYRYGATYGFSNEITLKTLKPEWSQSLRYVPAIVYGMVGFELVSAAGAEIRRPARDVPAAVLMSGFIVLFLYAAATAGILAAVPADEVDIVEGLVDTLALLLADLPASNIIVPLLGACALYTFFSNGATWAFGCNRATAEAAEEGQFPSLFAWRHPKLGTPIGAAMLMGLTCTGALILYGRIAQSNADLFWGLFSFSAVIFLLPYIGMALAFLKLRKSDANSPRPFRVPGGPAAAIALTASCVIVMAAAIFLFLYVPGEGWQRSTAIGVIVVLAAGEIIMRLGNLERKLFRKRA